MQLQDRDKQLQEGHRLHDRDKQLRKEHQLQLQDRYWCSRCHNGR